MMKILLAFIQVTTLLFMSIESNLFLYKKSHKKTVDLIYCLSLNVWWAVLESNQLPLACQASTLTANL